MSSRFNTTAFNSTQPPAQVVSAVFAKVLEDAKIANPTSRFEIIGGPDAAVAPRPPRRPPADQAHPPHRPRARRRQDPARQLKDTLANDRDLLFERITNFGGTVAGETRTLALIATVASWVIIIAYLWWRFHSFTYGLAAVLAVVHDVLITLGAIAVSYWLAKVPV